MFRFAVFFCLFAACYASIALPLMPAPKTPIAGRIVGGEETSIQSEPHQVSMLRSGSLRCGGSIIRANVIATAAHCTAGISASGLSIRAGSDRYASGGQNINVGVIIQHESYNSNTIDYDISLLELVSSISLSSTAALIGLPAQGANPADGAAAVTSGWGATSQGGSIAQVLRRVEIPIVNQSTCNSAYSQLGMSISDRMICAGIIETGGKDACQGDSGGPLRVGNTLVGITSWGYGCARAGYPGVWARVPALRSWIDSKLSRSN